MNLDRQIPGGDFYINLIGKFIPDRKTRDLIMVIAEGIGIQQEYVMKHIPGKLKRNWQS